MGGAFVCLTLFSSLVIACSLGTGTRVRGNAVALSAGRWLSLSVTAYFAALFLALFLAPCLAYGEELETTEVIGTIDSFDELPSIDATEGVEVLGDGEELPGDALEDTFDVRRIDDGMLLAVKGSDGTIVVKSVVSPEPLSTAAGMLWDYLSKALTRSQLVYAIENDLAWRWYHADSVKRAKVPLVPSNDRLYTPLNNDTFTGSGSAQEQYDRWYRYNHQFWPLTFPYELRTIDGGSWSPSSGASISDFQNYAAWYNWFEGISESNGGSITNPQPLSVVQKPIKQDGEEYTGTAPSYTGQDVSISFTEAQYSTITSRLQARPYGLVLRVRRDVSGSGSTIAYILVSETPISVTVNEISNTALITSGVRVKQYNVVITGTDMYVSTSSSTGATQASLNWGNSMAFSKVNNDNGNTYNITYACWMYSNQGISSGGGNPSVPVYPTYPEMTKPQQPSVTINAPTYNTYTTNETTTTTADLTPILNAIRILNDNTVNGFDNLTESLDTHFDNVHRMLEAWFTDFSNWLELIYEELQQVNRYLEGIYFNTSGNDEAPIYPDLEDGNTIEQQTDVNLELLKKKFPTSIPWDLYGILTLLETAPVAPSITLPVVMTEYTITIDLSDFSPMAAVSRRMSVLLFAVGLLMNTKRIASIDIGANHGN